YVAEDGERLTLFEWESADTLRAWATHPEHLPVQELGRQKFYTQYHLQVCELVRESKFVRDAKRARQAVYTLHSNIAAQQISTPVEGVSLNHPTAMGASVPQALRELG